MRVIMGTYHPHDQLVREIKVGDELPLPGHQRRIFQPRHRTPDQFFRLRHAQLRTAARMFT